MVKKKIVFVFLFLFPVTLLLSQNIEFEYHLVDTSTYWQLAPDIVFYKPSTIFLTWTDNFLTDTRIYLRKSTDGGKNFLPPVEPEPFFTPKLYSSIDVNSSGNPYLVWSDKRSGYSNIRFSKSTDGGGSFISSIPVDSADVTEIIPEIKVSLNGQRVFVAWLTLYGDSITTDSSKLYLSRSTDGGVSFLPPQFIGGISENQQGLFSFDITNGGDTVAFVWQNSSSVENLFFTLSVNSGNSFFAPLPVDTGSSKHIQPSLSLSGDSTVYIVYADDSVGNWDIRMASRRISGVPSFTHKIIDADPHRQDQPSIDIDNESNIYVSYRDGEYLSRPLTSIAIKKKGASIFHKDWVGIFGYDNTDSKITVKDSSDIFITWEYHIHDSMSITIFSRSVPAAAPEPPQNLLANGANPSPWDSVPDFIISFIKPYDPSGIILTLYKLGSPPIDNFDTTGTFTDTSSSDTSTFMVTDNVQGGDPLYVWLMDSRGNVDFHNNSSVLLRYDRTPPSAPALIEPEDGSLTNNPRPIFSWYSVSDLESGVNRYIIGVFSDLILNDTIFVDWTPDTFITPTIDLPNDSLYWVVLAHDFAGNLSEASDTFLIRIDSLPPKIEAVVTPNPSHYAHIGDDFTLSVTSNKTLKSITSYLIGSHNNRLDIELKRDSIDTDSTKFVKTFTLIGLETGPAMLYVEATDIYNKVGKDSVYFDIVPKGSFLPEDKVYTWPNPAQDEVHFRFFVGRNANVTIEIFTISGKHITTISETGQGGDRNAEIIWNTKDVGSDLYIFRLQVQSMDNVFNESIIKKFAIVK